MKIEFNKIPTEDFRNYLLRMVDKLRSPHFIYQYIQFLQERSEELMKVAGMSYFHENDFLKLSIYEDDNYKLRVHLWNRSNKRTGKNIHDHRFDCYSYVLKGEMKNTIFIEDDYQGVDLNYYHYYSRGKNDNYLLEYCGKKRIQQQTKETISSGDDYFIGKNILHQSVCMQDDTITIFVEDRSTLKEYARVYSADYVDKTQELDSKSIGIAEVIENLKKVAAN